MTIDDPAKPARLGNRSAGRRLLDVFLTACAIVGLVVTAMLSFNIWSTAREAQPVIALLETQHGGPISEFGWYEHDEARKIFCAHPDDDPADNLIGRTIDAGHMYWPALLLTSLGIGAAALLFIGAATVAGPPFRRLMIYVTVAMVGVWIYPLITYWSTITTLTYITE